jgi:TPR repeat protein
MQSREISFHFSLFTQFRFGLIILILVLCLTGRIAQVASAQSSNNGTITRLLPQATAGQIRSQVNLANEYLRTNRPEDLQEAIRWYRVAANSGDLFSQTQLGTMLESGVGSAVDLAQAREWYRRAAGEGYLPAMVLLASMYSQGKGVPQDHDEALHLLKPAAEQGYAPAKTDLAVLYLRARDAPAHDVDAVHLLHKAVGGDAKAAFVLGWCYQQERGVKRNLAEAARWYTKAANQGFAAAENNLGFLYETGGGVPANVAAALGWYRRAAEHGIPDAALSVAKLLLGGPEPVRDRNGALLWFAIARRIGARGAESEAELDRLMQETSAIERQAIDDAAARWLTLHQPNNRTASFDTAQLPTSHRDDK